MKKIFAAATCVATLVSIYSFKKLEVATYTVDAKSKVEWIGSKKDGFHPGQFAVKSGTVSVEGGKLTGGKFVIDIAGMKVNDDAGAALEGHLKKSDVFDAEKFPEATFEITAVKYTTAANADVTGTLTVKGKPTTLTIPVIVRSADDKKFFGQAFFSLSAPSLGLPQISAPDVQVSVYLFATK